MSDARVRFRSDHPLFGRTFSFSANGSAVFRLDAAFNTSGTSVAVPVAPFTLRADHPQTLLTSPPAAGDFEPGLTTATRDVVFSDKPVANRLRSSRCSSRRLGETLARVLVRRCFFADRVLWPKMEEI